MSTILDFYRCIAGKYQVLPRQQRQFPTLFYLISAPPQQQPSQRNPVVLSNHRFSLSFRFNLLFQHFDRYRLMEKVLIPMSTVSTGRGKHTWHLVREYTPRDEGTSTAPGVSILTHLPFISNPTTVSLLRHLSHRSYETYISPALHTAHAPRVITGTHLAQVSRLSPVSLFFKPLFSNWYSSVPITLNRDVTGEAGGPTTIPGSHPGSLLVPGMLPGLTLKPLLPVSPPKIRMSQREGEPGLHWWGDVHKRHDVHDVHDPDHLPGRVPSLHHVKTGTHDGQTGDIGTSAVPMDQGIPRQHHANGSTGPGSPGQPEQAKLLNPMKPLNVDLHHLTDQVYRMLEKKIRTEKERRGW